VAPWTYVQVQAVCPCDSINVDNSVISQREIVLSFDHSWETTTSCSYQNLSGLVSIGSVVGGGSLRPRVRAGNTKYLEILRLQKKYSLESDENSSVIRSSCGIRS
jgi:hypothetical protein